MSEPIFPNSPNWVPNNSWVYEDSEVTIAPAAAPLPISPKDFMYRSLVNFEDPQNPNTDPSSPSKDLPFPASPNVAFTYPSLPAVSFAESQNLNVDSSSSSETTPFPASPDADFSIPAFRNDSPDVIFAAEPSDLPLTSAPAVLSPLPVVSTPVTDFSLLPPYSPPYSPSLRPILSSPLRLRERVVYSSSSSSETSLPISSQSDLTQRANLSAGPILFSPTQSSSAATSQLLPLPTTYSFNNGLLSTQSYPQPLSTPFLTPVPSASPLPSLYSSLALFPSQAFQAPDLPQFTPSDLSSAQPSRFLSAYPAPASWVSSLPPCPSSTVPYSYSSQLSNPPVLPILVSSLVPQSVPTSESQTPRSQALMSRDLYKSMSEDERISRFYEHFFDTFYPQFTTVLWKTPYQEYEKVQIYGKPDLTNKTILVLVRNDQFFIEETVNLRDLRPYFKRNQLALICIKNTKFYPYHICAKAVPLQEDNITHFSTTGDIGNRLTMAPKELFSAIPISNLSQIKNLDFIEFNGTKSNVKGYLFIKK